jgi:hypothetical protein
MTATAVPNRIGTPLVLDTLAAKIESIDWSRARDDVRAFVRGPDLPALDVWGREFFLAQMHKLPE